MIFGFTAYVIDIGLVYIEKTKLSNAVDAAVLAAALELPRDDEKAEEVALDYLKKNNVDCQNIVIDISEDKKSIQIHGDKNVKHLFAILLGIDKSNVKVNTKAVIGPARTVKGGIRPFAVEMYNFNYGDLVTLKEDAGDGYDGNYGGISLGGEGANVFKLNALYGYSGTISVGDMIPTEPGNIAGATMEIQKYIDTDYSSFNNFNRDSERLWTIPLVNSMMVNGKKEVLVLGFGQFFVENVKNKAGKIEIEGRFIKYVINGEIDMNLSDTGVYGVKLER